MLAARIVVELGVDVEAVYFVNAFLQGYRDRATMGSYPVLAEIAREAGIRLHVVDIARAHLQIVQSPKYGYGEHMNPCIDCRIIMLKQAKEFMQKNGFSFIVSGEVLGQRPMSQRREALNIIDRDADCKGLILRPLCAKLLKPTSAEEKGWVDREKLCSFSGRSRKPQLVLAQELGVKKHLAPAGGCLLTDPAFARKFRNLCGLGKVDVRQVQLLKIGRHFYFSPAGIRIIVGRDEQENSYLEKAASAQDTLMKMGDFSGPLTIILGNGLGEMGKLLEVAARITARYSKGKEEKLVRVEYWNKREEKRHSLFVQPTLPGESRADGSLRLEDSLAKSA